MTEPVSLTCTSADFDRLITAVHKVRKGSTSVRVDLGTLEALLIDHGRLLRITPHKEPQA